MGKNRRLPFSLNGLKRGVGKKKGGVFGKLYGKGCTVPTKAG